MQRRGRFTVVVLLTAWVTDGLAELYGVQLGVGQ